MKKSYSKSENVKKTSIQQKLNQTKNKQKIRNIRKVYNIGA